MLSRVLHGLMGLYIWALYPQSLQCYRSCQGSTRPELKNQTIKLQLSMLPGQLIWKLSAPWSDIPQISGGLNAAPGHDVCAEEIATNDLSATSHPTVATWSSGAALLGERWGQR